VPLSIVPGQGKQNEGGKEIDTEGAPEKKPAEIASVIRGSSKTIGGGEDVEEQRKRKERIDSQKTNGMQLPYFPMRYELNQHAGPKSRINTGTAGIPRQGMPAYPDGFGGNPVEKVAVEKLGWACSQNSAELQKFADDLFPLKCEPGADKPAR